MGEEWPAGECAQVHFSCCSKWLRLHLPSSSGGSGCRLVTARRRSAPATPSSRAKMAQRFLNGPGAASTSVQAAFPEWAIGGFRPRVLAGLVTAASPGVVFWVAGLTGCEGVARYRTCFRAEWCVSGEIESVRAGSCETLDEVLLRTMQFVVVYCRCTVWISSSLGVVDD
mmetsp:Transcript_2451/g.5597  ORF Transcript_2451/g.5597 Transcript_2451/m.5597 type:complete len:170 (+) Transcript_2451:619-1128(+)